MSNKQLSIYFCGGCNPQINRWEIAQAVTKLLSVERINVIYNSFEADLIVYLSGCSANCAPRYNRSDIPSIVVAAETVDAVAVEEGQIVGEIATRVRNFYRYVETPIPPILTP